ncbi:hypothetical protein FGO68_gene9587 [Halteria grandinella]|uniref:Uncharacterized protein n=1 Tax=Halteria grandinella TaxID=5974 RepID=A0A8J8SYI0_HALGN|nr:hypothetical protein FGO68_gene9587 [Halteria grandinella]
MVLKLNRPFTEPMISYKTGSIQFKIQIIVLHRINLIMSEEIDHHLEMQETNAMLLRQFEQAVEETHPDFTDTQVSDPPSPTKKQRKKERIVERLLSSRAKFDDRTALFNLINSIALVYTKNHQALTIYNLSSIVNIEGQTNLKLSESTQIYSYYTWNDQGFTVYYLIIILIMVHILKLLTCLVGKINTQCRLLLCCLKI